MNRTAGPVADLLYVTRLLGGEPDLALHGGGNTSVKTSLKNIFGEEVPALFVKASGADMATAGRDDLVPMDLAFLFKMRSLESLSDELMAEEFRLHLLRPSSRLPSLETLMHAFIPEKIVLHTHPSAILALVNREKGEALAKEALGHEVGILPYTRAGFELAAAVEKAYAKELKGLILLQHGLTTWADDPQTAYDRMIEIVSKAEEIIAPKSSRRLKSRPAVPPDLQKKYYRDIAPRLRGLLARQTQDPDNPFKTRIILPIIDEDANRIISSEKGRKICLSSPLTPDYLIRTKLYPLWVDHPPLNDAARLEDHLKKALAAYKKAYEEYVLKHASPGDASFISEEDFQPRVVIIPGIGGFCSGDDAAAASVCRDITRQALKVKASIFESGGTYKGLPEDHLFDMEFRSFQQAKVNKKDAPPLAGRVALVTGSAGAIGRGICERLLAEGCQVALTDLAAAPLAAAVRTLKERYGDAAVGVPLDVSDPGSVAEGFGAVVDAFGGVDIVVLNAGIAHAAPLVELDLETFRKLERVNTEGTLLVIAEAARIFGKQKTGGDIVLISTKNVFAPGAKFGAYSATKAASHQLARIAGLELAEIGVRVNMVAPDAVFSHGAVRSGLWAEVGPDRMRARGLDEKGLEEYYRSRNLLKARVTADHVANAVMFFVTHQTPTTGATIPVDGGLPDATPR